MKLALSKREWRKYHYLAALLFIVVFLFVFMVTSLHNHLDEYCDVACAPHFSAGSSHVLLNFKPLHECPVCFLKFVLGILLIVYVFCLPHSNKRMGAAGCATNLLYTHFHISLPSIRAPPLNPFF